MDSFLALHHDEKEDGTSPDDVLVRRLKNRERQRRYRARKRHEADLRKASIINQSTSPDCVTHVDCQRDWKKDARRAHIHKQQEPSPIGSSNSGIIIPVGSSATFLKCEGKADLLLDHSNTPIIDNNATFRLQSIRRHWKAEARNKKSSE